jgi:hypothetical protein
MIMATTVKQKQPPIKTAKPALANTVVTAIKSAKPALANTVVTAALLNQRKAWALPLLLFVLPVLLAIASYGFLLLQEPLLIAWSTLSSKLSEISLMLSEQASDLRRLKALVKEIAMAKDASASTVTDVPEGQGSRWAMLLEIRNMFAYIMFVYEHAWRTLGLLLVTSVTGLFSWLDWTCTLFQDLVTRAYSDPRGLLFNLLLFGCLSATVGLVALACFVGSILLEYVVPSSAGLPKHLWSWGFFLLGLLNPTTWFPSSGTGAVPEQQPGTTPSAPALAQLSDKLDASTARIQDQLISLESAVRAARLELPQELRNLGDQGQGSLDHAIELLLVKQETVHLAVIRELANNTLLTSEL